MRTALPSFVANNYARACQGLLLNVPGCDATRREALVSLGAAFEHEALPEGGLRSLDASGALSGLDGDDLADWWSDDCWVRELVWAGAASGSTAAIDWLLWAIHLAARGGAEQLVSLLALDARDASRVALNITCGTHSASVWSAHRSPVRIFQWLTSQQIRLASTVDRTARPTGSATLTRAWLDGSRSDRGAEFDTLLHASIVGETAIVAEFDHGVRRHVLIPVASVDPESIDSDHYCIDVLRRRGGWLTRIGRWTWDDQRADPTPPLPSRVWSMAGAGGS